MYFEGQSAQEHNTMKISEILRLRSAQDSNSSELDMGREVELEHKSTIEYLKKNPNTPVDKAVEMIARDHLKELPDYYTRLKKMEEAGKTTKADPVQQKLIDFFKANPNPDDDLVHQFAAKLGMEPDDLETKIYALLTSLL